LKAEQRPPVQSNRKNDTRLYVLALAVAPLLKKPLKKGGTASAGTVKPEERHPLVCTGARRSATFKKTAEKRRNSVRRYSQTGRTTPACMYWRSP